MEMVERPSSSVHTSKEVYLLSQLANFDQILWKASSGQEIGSMLFFIGTLDAMATHISHRLIIKKTLKIFFSESMRPTAYVIGI